MKRIIDFFKPWKQTIRSFAGSDIVNLKDGIGQYVISEKEGNNIDVVIQNISISKGYEKYGTTEPFVAIVTFKHK